MCNPADIGNFDLTVGAGSALFKPVPAFSLLLGSAGAVDALTRALAVDLAPLRVGGGSFESWIESCPIGPWAWRPFISGQRR